MTNSGRTVALLVGGGPAPGINAVIASVVRAARARGWRVLGVTRGFSRLVKRDASAARELTERDVAGIDTRGGSVLLTARTNPAKKPEDLAAVVETLRSLGVTDLVTIGGEDTASSAAKVGDALGGVRVAHVPKTIDNDLPLPEGVPTFGFDTARHLAGTLCRNLAEDARTTGRWYLVTGMGRTAGHLALAMGSAAGADLILLPEEFPTGVTLDVIARWTEAAVVKRRAEGSDHGLVVYAEGILEKVPEADFARLPGIERDEHGHPRLSEVSLGRIVRDALKDRLAGTSFVAKEIGYELRCADPTAFDVAYARSLGVGAVEFLAAGKGHAIVALVRDRLSPIPLDSVRDPATGRVRTRTLDPASDAWRAQRALEARLSPRDLEGDALKRLADAAKLDPAECAKRYATVAKESLS